MKNQKSFQWYVVVNCIMTFWAHMNFAQQDLDFFQKYKKQQQENVSFASEKIPVHEFANAKDLGQATALTFLQWVDKHPNGVISLPTGKTPEMFIKALHFYKDYWNEPSVVAVRLQYGLKSDQFPKTSGLKFVQMDEFFGMTFEHQNSFSSYVVKHYVDFFEIPKENCLLMNFADMDFAYRDLQMLFEDQKVDLSLLEKEAASDIERKQQAILLKVQDFCKSYEKQIRQWGGIGFFLGGIGPEGHIAFNMSGAEFDSKTRLVALNYPSAAAAAVSLGGIEYSRDQVAMTIGLATILHNPDVKIIIFSAGESKARVVQNTVEGTVNQDFPGTIFQHAHDASFFVTSGSAKDLTDRKRSKLLAHVTNFSQEQIDDIVISLALRLGKKLQALNEYDFQQDQYASLLMHDYQKMVDQVERRLEKKLQQGLEVLKGQSIVHTAPHHDDVMLSYHAYAVKHLRSNRNVFAYLTSGFNSVTDGYIQSVLHSVVVDLIKQLAVWIFKESYHFILQKFAEVYEKQDKEAMQRYEQIILLRYIAYIFKCETVEELYQKVVWLQNNYFPAKYHGQKDSKDVQTLKGCMRESEVDRMWAIHTHNHADVQHFRSPFYTGQYFTPQPNFQQDVQPMVDCFEKYQPDVITVALDPEGTGPDTHYKVLQLVAAALQQYKNKNVKVVGYRNVWHRFSLAEATMVVPVSQDEIDHMESIFLSCFSTQKNASFPSLYHDGPFSELIAQEQKRQWKQVTSLVSDEFLEIVGYGKKGDAVGCIFLKTMNYQEFMQQAAFLKQSVE